jgi:hypothetical protein
MYKLISYIGTKLAVTSNLIFLRSVRRLLVTASVVPSSPILVTLIKEALSSSEMSVLIRATLRNIPEDTILFTLQLVHGSPKQSFLPVFESFHSFVNFPLPRGSQYVSCHASVKFPGFLHHLVVITGSETAVISYSSSVAQSCSTCRKIVPAHNRTKTNLVPLRESIYCSYPLSILPVSLWRQTTAETTFSSKCS